MYIVVKMEKKMHKYLRSNKNYIKICITCILSEAYLKSVGSKLMASVKSCIAAVY